jgi:hypothetical protein
VLVIPIAADDREPGALAARGWIAATPKALFQTEAGSLELTAALDVHVAGEFIGNVYHFGVFHAELAVEERTRVDDVVSGAET